MIEKPYENWLDIPNYEELYEIDTFGNIKSKDKKVKNKNGYRIIKGKILKPKYDKYGYLKIGLTKNNKQKFYFVHRLVAKTFLPNPNNYLIINHKDGNKTNNYIGNLEWCTQKYNIKHAYDNGLKKGVSADHKGSKHPRSKLTEKEVQMILENKKAGVHIKACYVLFKDKISFKGFQNIWYGYAWKHLVEKVEE